MNWRERCLSRIKLPASLVGIFEEKTQQECDPACKRYFGQGFILQKPAQCAVKRTDRESQSKEGCLWYVVEHGSRRFYQLVLKPPMFHFKNDLSLNAKLSAAPVVNSKTRCCEIQTGLLKP